MTVRKLGKLFPFLSGLLTIIIFFLTSCESAYIRMDDEGTHALLVDTVHFSTQIQPVLYNNCASCHFAGTSLDLESQDVYTNLINGNFIDTASPESSRLFTEGGTGHADDYLTIDEHTLIVRWIQQGALNN